MVFQKRNTAKDSSEAKEKKSKMTEKATKRAASKSDILKPNKQLKEVKKSMEESSVSSEDLSNDMTPVNRSSDESEGGSVAEICGSGNSSASDSVSSSLPNKKSNLTKIPFEPGLRLEAKDLGNEIWYSVKVVEVDWEEEEILIHFEKWSQRYDEWISMDSSRLRPIQEPIPPNRMNKKGSKVFKVGDTVNATWSDSRKYPATVKAVLSGDKYEVLFMDGYTKIIKGTRMARMKEGDMLNAEQFDPEKLGVFKVPEKPPAPPVLSPLITDTETIGTKAERRERKRKLNVAELFHVKKRPRKSPPSPSPSISKPSESEKEKTDEKKKESHQQKQEELEQEQEDKQKQRESRQKRPSSDDCGEPKDSEVESVAPEVEADVKSVVPEPTPPPETVKTVEDEAKKDERDTKVRRKIIPKLRGRDEEEIKPRRRMKRVDKTDAGGRPNVRKGILAYKMNKKFARKGLQDRKDQSYSPENVDPAVPGSSQESTEAPKTKKREVQEGEVEKPTRKSALDGWEPEGEPAYIVESAEGLRKSIIVPDKRLPEGWIKHMIQRKGGHSAGKWDVFFVCPQGRKFRSRHELRNYFEEKGEEFPREQFDFSLGRRKMRWTARDASAANKTSSPGQPRGIGRGKPPVPSTPEEQPVRRVKTLLPKVRVPQAEDGGGGTGPDCSSPRSPLPPYTTTVAPLSAGRLPDEGTDGGVLVGSLKIQMENDAFMCPKEGCNKHFRKENLLQMHIKHYHPEYNKFMGSTPNVADLAYARTIGEPVEDLIPKARYSVASPTFLEKINRFEANRKAKNLGVSAPTGLSPTSGGAAAAPDFIPVERKKSLGKDMKPGLVMSSKKTVKAEIENSSSESSSAAEDAISVTARQEENPPVLEPALTAVREERKEQQQPTIRTLLPVVRTAAPAQELTLAERLKMHCPSEDSLGDAVLRKDQLVAPQSPQQPSQPQPPLLQQQTPLSSQSSMPHLTKSMRTVRRKHMSDFHMEPLMRKRKSAKAPELMPEDADLNEDGSLHSDSSNYRYSRKKLPVVHLEKLQTTTDSNASLEGEDRSKSPLLESPAKTRVEQLRREEIINCICGYNEEDGLMIQCDLCLCWQHGLCSKIEKETDVPEKYVCPICVNPPRERRSKHYLHDQDWLKEGTLPSFSFRSKNLENIKQREMVLKRTHELTATLHQLNQVIHSLRVKVNIAEAPDQHPKLYLWAKSWEDDDMDLTPQVPTQLSVQNFKREAKPLPDPLLQSLDHQTKLEMSSEHSYGEQLKPDLGSFDSLPLLHAFGKEVKTELSSQPHIQEQKKHGELVQMDKDLSENGTEGTKQDTNEPKVDENWSGSFSSRNLSYPMPPSAMEEDMCSVSSAEPFHVNLSEDEHTSPEPMSLDPSEEQSACSNLLNLNPSEEEVPSPSNMRLSEDEEPTVDSPTKEGFEPAVDDADTKDTEMSVDSTGNSEIETKKDMNVPEELGNVKESKSEPVQKEADKETAVGDEQPQAVEEMEMVEPAEEIVEAAEETVESQAVLEPPDSMVETVEQLLESREEVVESSVENVTPVEETVESQKGIPEPMSTEEVAKPPEMQNGLENCNPPSPAHVDSHILHQVLTNGISSLNSDDAVDTQNMLQLPLCQSELMQLATSIADNLEEEEPERPQLQEPVPEALIDPNECRTRLLDHIENYHQQIESRLTTIEAQIAALESMDPHSASDEAADYYPQTKQTVQMLLRDLETVRRISAFN